MKLPDKTIERFNNYRQILIKYKDHDKGSIFSYDLARLLNFNPALVQRDLMILGFTGNSDTKHDVPKLIEKINNAIENGSVQNVCIIGTGNLATAAINYLAEEEINLRIVAAFDFDSRKVNKLFSRVMCYPIKNLEEIIKKKNITISVLTIQKEYVNEIAQLLIKYGIKGILNFTPVSLDLPDHIYLEEINISSNLDKIVYYSE